MGEASEWSRGWRTVASGTLGMTAMAGVASVTGVVMEPLQHEFGWPRAVVAVNVFLCSAMALLLAPVGGALTSRLGARKVAICGTLGAIPGLLLISLTGGSPWTWYGAWTAFAVVNVAIGPMVWSVAVSGLFERARGFALAVTLSGGGLAHLLFPPLAVLMEAHYGWRGVYIAIAAVFLIVLLPVLLFLFRAREDLAATQPVEAIAVDKAARVQEPLATGLSLKQALGTRHFWQLALLALVVAFVEGTLTVHLFPILKEEGLSGATAAGIASAMGLSLIVGRLVTGILLDRLQSSHVFAASILFLLFCCFMARVVAGNATIGIAVGILLGLGSGGTTGTLAYMTGRYFGLRAYAAIFGMLIGIFALGYGIAPSIAGYARDAATSYAPLFLYLTFACAVSTVLAFTLGKGRRNANVS